MFYNFFGWYSNYGGENMMLVEMLEEVSKTMEKLGFKRVAANYVDNGVLFAMYKDGQAYLFSIHLPKKVEVKESGMINIDKFTADIIIKNGGFYTK